MNPREKRIRKLMLDADILTIKEAADAIRVHKSTLWRAIRGETHGPRTQAAFEAFLAERLGRPVKIAWPKAA